MFSDFYIYVLTSIKERIEEDRFMREQTKEFLEKKKQSMKEKMHHEEEAHYAEKIAPAMAQAESVLKKSGSWVSHDGLEALAKWKLGL